MSIVLLLVIVALALLIAVMVAAASSYSIPARHVMGAQSPSKPTTDPVL